MKCFCLVLVAVCMLVFATGASDAKACGGYGGFGSLGYGGFGSMGYGGFGSAGYGASAFGAYGGHCGVQQFAVPYANPYVSPFGAFYAAPYVNKAFFFNRGRAKVDAFGRVRFSGSGY